MNWHAVELHTHTHHSDGKMTVPELIQQSKQENLSLIALTDHNTRSGLREAGTGIIPGIEWTMYHGHMTILGGSRYIDWRDINPDRLDDKLWAVKAAGGLACVAHPYRIGSPICTGCHFDYHVRDLALIPLWEIWSGENPALLESNALSYQKWVEMLDGGYRPAAVYGRDWHVPTPRMPVAVTYIGSEDLLTADSALEALRQGRTAVSMGPLPLLKVWQNNVCYWPGDTLAPGHARVDTQLITDIRREVWEPYGLTMQQVRLKGAHSLTLESQPVHAKGNRFDVNLQAGPVWIEFWGEMDGNPCLIALTNALHVQHRTLICAHAGALGEQPNSLASFEAAIGAGCDMLEVDLRQYGGQIVLSHDKPEGNNAALVTLAQCLLRVYPEPGMIVNIDSKEPGLAAQAIASAKEIGMGSRIVFTGDFNQADRLAFPERSDAFWNLPMESAQALHSDPDAFAAQGLSWMNLDVSLINEDLMQKANHRHIRVSGWTADTQDDIQALLTLGAGSITTNRPDAAIRLRSILEGGNDL